MGRKLTPRALAGEGEVCESIVAPMATITEPSRARSSASAVRRPVDLNRIVTFVNVVEAGSFTGAATRLGVPKSSISRGVSHLEEELGTRLLQRTTRKLMLTDAGRAYYERARVHLSALEDATNEVSDMGRDPRGTVRVTAPVDIGTALLADLVTRFVKKHPTIRVELSLTSRRVDLVAEGFDVAVRAGNLEDSTLIVRRIAMSALALFAAPAYLRKHGTPRTVADLAEHDLVMFRTHNQAVLRLVGPDGPEEVSVRGPIEADELGFVHAAVVAGAGVGLLPTFLCATDCHADKAKRTVRVLPHHTVPASPINVVVPSTRQEPARVTVFREFLVAELSKVQWGDEGR